MTLALYGVIAEALHLKDLIDDDRRLKAKTNNPDGIAEAIKKWLDIPENHNWLIVFDDYDDEDLLLRNYIPSSLGKIIVTSRMRLASTGRPIEVGILKTDEAKTRLRQSFPEDKIWTADERTPPYCGGVRSTCLGAGNWQVAGGKEANGKWEKIEESINREPFSCI